MCCRQNDDGLTIATALDEMHKIESHIDQKNSSDFPVGFHSICDKKKEKNNRKKKKERKWLQELEEQITKRKLEMNIAAKEERK